jgi:hypothetical protein
MFFQNFILVFVEQNVYADHLISMLNYVTMYNVESENGVVSLHLGLYMN